jgi:hypothetical protein
MRGSAGFHLAIKFQHLYNRPNRRGDFEISKESTQG